MEVLQTAQHVTHVHGHHRFAQRPRAAQKARQAAARNEFHHDLHDRAAVRRLRQPRAVKLHEVRVPRVPHDRDFVDDIHR
jgi:hypothetical protein